MHYFSNLFDKVLYTFGHVHCPSSGVSQHCIHAIGICHASSVGCLLAEGNRTRMTNTFVCIQF